MRILLTGGSGQFGKAFLRLAAHAGHMVSAPGHAELPIESEAAAHQVVGRERPDWVVHAGAMTDVDGCERDPQRAHAVNALGSENMAKAAARHGARMVLVSTDYVFDGEKGHYAEDDLTNPVSEYGRSKREGEMRAEAVLPTLCIARTSVVFGPDRNNFVLWVRRSLRDGKPVRVARDQWVSPTCTDDLARQVLALVDARAEGVYHTAGAERLSRLEMAHRIAAHDRVDPAPIQPVAMSDLTWVAKRPRDSSLDVSKVSRLARPMGFDAALGTLGAAA